MYIDINKMAGLVEELKKDVSGMCARSSVPIGKIGKATFELVAYNDSEAEEMGIGEIREEHECITR